MFKTKRHLQASVQHVDRGGQVLTTFLSVSQLRHRPSSSYLTDVTERKTNWFVSKQILLNVKKQTFQMYFKETD